jgi:hypothetical protein
VILRQVEIMDVAVAGGGAFLHFARKLEARFANEVRLCALLTPNVQRGRLIADVCAALPDRRDNGNVPTTTGDCLDVGGRKMTQKN